MATSPIEAKVASIIEPSLGTMGYDLVRVQVQGARNPTLQVMAERHDGLAMTVEDCAAISRALSALLDVEEPLQGAYTLEVSSPGIDRPLMRPRDYERHVGHEAKIEIRFPREGRKRFRGRILAVSATGVRMALDEGESDFSFAEIDKAKLVGGLPTPGAMAKKKRSG